jgi:UPF0271 protein
VFRHHGFRFLYGRSENKMLSIDLNCDLGEGFGVYALGDDEKIMPLISSASIACGFHASTPSIMLRTVALAKRFGVAVGAHPSYPDLAGFGRRAMNIAQSDLKADLMYQIGALMAFCLAEAVPLRHVKAHGALYNRAMTDMVTADTIADAVHSVSQDLYLLCPAGSAMAKAAEKLGLKVIAEAFADRAYTSDGALFPRSREGAVLRDPLQVAERVLSMVRERKVKTVDGSIIDLPLQSICVHGDTPGAVEMIRAIRSVLESEGIVISPPVS